ncbi:hypothetical protein KC340_g10362 [Hortaea werneckii]|nr:hypothetical protein KC342_g10595 [Hortaea werneckii]KAI7065137.1 hypothetical protein KC339_g15872 [Hortaea werneckii]KAI7214084.1 hypothetical protein KC365_g14048 [Hortaea werneckii]KAI7310863.1 hypothetical protein KC340_g10362 [Hortaea werneckii]KAI7392570.1 hypothetical protein KC328_g6982 [Hortaea werneckii]
MEGRTAEPIPEPPEAVHPRPNNAENESDNEREATELHTIAEQHRTRQVTTSPGRPQEWHADIKRLWRHHIRLSIPHVDCRDHLANERTYLGYLRTSLALSMVGVIISQLYRLQHSPSPDPVYGYYALGKPIASIFHASALGVVLVGAVRFFRQQSAMSIGKVHAGGWEVLVICGWVLLLLLAVLALHIGVDVYDAS